MPEDTFLATDAEYDRLIEFVIAEGAWLVPDRHYETSIYEEIRSLSDYRSRKRCVMYYVLHERWPFEGFSLKEVENKHLGKGYYIQQRVGGPAISLTYHPERTEPDPALLGVGSIHHFPFYYHINGRVKFETPKLMRDFYKALATEIRRQSKKVRSPKQPSTVWIMAEAIKAVKAGQKKSPWEFLSLEELCA